MSHERTAVIIGAGIGGLAAGLALLRAGWKVQIHERESAPRELGFGISLAPNALSALGELGVAEEITRAGERLARIEFRRVNGRVLRRVSLPTSFPSVVVLRPHLHAVLLRAVGDNVIGLGREAVSFSESAAGATVHFKDGSTTNGSALIGADGVHSAIRKRLHPNEPPPRASGFCAVRGVAYGVGDHLGDLSGVGYLDNGIEAATIRASADAIYWYMSLRSRDVTDTDPRAIVDRRLAGFEPALQAILTATEPENLRFDVLFERDALRTWGAGRVTLLGDAAHPLLPHTGQGAAQSLEDAVALGLSMSAGLDVQRGLRLYERVRSRRTRAFIKLGPRIARVTTTRNVAIRTARALALSLIPDRALMLSARSFRQDPHRELRRSLTTR